MEYGYVFTYDGKKIRSELQFAKKYFNFIELTIKLRKNPSDVLKSKIYLTSIKILGHLDWSIDLSEFDPDEIRKSYNYLLLFKKLGIKKVTIHPSPTMKLDTKKVIENNLRSLSKITDYCLRNGINLMIENTTSIPFNKAGIIKKFLDEIPTLSLTLDVGHALRSSKSELGKFLKMVKKIGHIHLHDVFSKEDHLFFRDHKKLKRIVDKIKENGYDKTISFECFGMYRDGKIIEVTGNKRRLLLISHLKVLRES